jgi:MFS family permease
VSLRFEQLALLALGFLLGVALMSFQMIASRLLTPYFGSGIEVWASLISATMLALMAGYYLGGMIADRAPRSQVLGAAVLAAGGLLALIPFAAQPVLTWAMDNTGENLVAGALTSALVLLVAPLTLMSFFSPYAVRLLLADAAHGGKVAGSVYSITTIGNIVGTLGTSFWLMPLLGSRSITFIYAGLVAACGITLILLRVQGRAHAQ